MSADMAVTWELHYADGSTRQPLPGIAQSIRDARPGAVLLVLMRGTARLGSIALEAPKDRPVFYRVRAIDGVGPGAGGPAFDVGVVFGRSTPDGEECDLWTIVDGEFIACPPDLFDTSGVRTCLGLT